MRKADIERELLRRSESFLSQKHLIVDYYRIRRRVAYPLPVRSFSILQMPLRNFPPANYPWATWLTWALEERIHALGWCGELLEDSAARHAVQLDVDALAQWPAFRQYPQPDLSLGHAARTLFAAHQSWGWLGADIRSRIESAFARLIEDVLPFSEKKHGAYKRKEEILALPDPLPALHNIPLIGTVGAALAAHVIKHPALATFNDRISMVFGALLDYRETGFTEGVAYDGYVLDFIADWFTILTEAQRKQWLSHPQMQRMLDESIALGVPGNILDVAQLSDVEPREMTFHVSAQAKLNAFEPTARRQWYLENCNFSWLRSDALAALYAEEFPTHPLSPPDGGILDAHYARVLRSGFDADDLAVAIPATTSGMGHMQCDGGSIVIGTAGTWLITDPGYQQYIETSEREFTLGPAAHNAPVINGAAQSAKKPRIRNLSGLPAGTHAVEVELADCYPTELKLSSVRRTVWLRHDDLVVVADRVRGSDIKDISYHWLGHADAGWWTENGMAKVATDRASLWIASPQAQLADAQIARRRGSRGQLTLTAKVTPSDVVWWVFSTDDAAPVIESMQSGLRVNGTVFELPG